MIITIDGPAASGKSTIARQLAARLRIPYLDTGAMYRVITLAALEDGLDLHDDDALAALAASNDWQLDLRPTDLRVLLRGRDVTQAIRSMTVNQHTRFIAAAPGVRHTLINKQRALAQQLGSLVTEGRDQGTAVFPNADAKFFLDADRHTRAQRRLLELQAAGQTATFTQVLANLDQRDLTDAQRQLAPLAMPPDALRIDTTNLSIPAVLDLIIQHLYQRGLLNHRGPTPSDPPAR